MICQYVHGMFSSERVVIFQTYEGGKLKERSCFVDASSVFGEGESGHVRVNSARRDKDRVLIGIHDDGNYRVFAVPVDNVNFD